ncbi:hypothetical protein [Curtobacterium sp. 9128]|uniref:hypothetical protein n=1 Tax=Curtobacterium sp. 9128 TaxID=1793722 RepID=UPI0011A578BE|nr:hypothetical protein [Curtobacterium sp. 9128]
MTFPALQRDDHTTGSTAEVFGVVTLEPDGVTLEPSRRAFRRHGVRTLRWGPTWTMQARPLRGPGGLVQRSVVAPGNDESSTFWVRGGKDFVFG